MVAAAAAGAGGGGAAAGGACVCAGGAGVLLGTHQAVRCSGGRGWEDMVWGTWMWCPWP